MGWLLGLVWACAAFADCTSSLESRREWSEIRTRYLARTNTPPGTPIEYRWHTGPNRHWVHILPTWAGDRLVEIDIHASGHYAAGMGQEAFSAWISRDTVIAVQVDSGL